MLHDTEIRILRCSVGNDPPAAFLRHGQHTRIVRIEDGHAIFAERLNQLSLRFCRDLEIPVHRDMVELHIGDDRDIGAQEVNRLAKV